MKSFLIPEPDLIFRDGNTCVDPRVGLLNYFPNGLESPNLNEDNFNLSFTYRHDCSVLEPGSLLAQSMVESNHSFGVDSKIDAMTASCDAWFYNNILKTPTLVYGPGTLKVAHSKDEKIDFQEVKKAACVLYNFVNNFKGES